MRGLWVGRGPLARAGRAGLLPLAGAVRLATRARAGAYDAGWLRRVQLPLPTVSVGNLSVGGTGKTPIAAWVAGWYAARGRRPAILLRGYGGDEAGVHREAAPEAIVVEDADRVRGAARAVARGAEILVLDDAFQHRRVQRDVDLVLVSAASLAHAPWSLPAGPWRESWSALARAHLAVITGRGGEAGAMARAARHVARVSPGTPVAAATLRLDRLTGLRSGRSLGLGLLAGARVLAASGIADPEGFRRQLTAAGARVTARAWRDHYPFGPREVRALVRAAAGVDYVVVTAKDATKLRGLWPEEVPEALVAGLTVHWDDGRAEVDRLLTTCLGNDDVGVRRGRGAPATTGADRSP